MLCEKVWCLLKARSTFYYVHMYLTNIYMYMHTDSFCRVAWFPQSLGCFWSKEFLSERLHLYPHPVGQESNRLYATNMIRYVHCITCTTYTCTCTSIALRTTKASYSRGVIRRARTTSSKCPLSSPLSSLIRSYMGSSPLTKEQLQIKILHLGDSKERNVVQHAPICTSYVRVKFWWTTHNDIQQLHVSMDK